MLELVAEKKTVTVIRIAVTGDAQEAIKRVAGKYRIKQEAVQSAVYEWFGKQDDIFQRAVLGLLDGLEVDAAKAFMERWAQRRDGGAGHARPNVTSDVELERSREAAQTRPAKQQPQSSHRGVVRSGRDESK